MNIFDDSNRRFKMRKEEESKALATEKERIANLKKAEIKLLNEFRSYIGKMATSIKALGYSTTDGSMTDNPSLAVSKNYNIGFDPVKLSYSVSTSSETAGTLYVTVTKLGSDEVEQIEYHLKENGNVDLPDDEGFNLEQEVIKHYEMVLNRM
ncbi:hypothetical protein [Macrococcus equipercicus]|uniref:Uncharacterized protein n=1 Tax=Macrococcus equipercicus TaxID=69967 RepID=A0A9Q9BML6_9STAP|nr:hypothetical protein [Macrococcus equipercicus]UTH13305.1 hypothetical protein KFV11_08530 [Macrococcus equipercicus]